MRYFLFILMTLLLSVSHASATELWTGILDTARAISWTTPGVTGGIPTTRTKYGATIAAYNGTADTINTAIAAASADQYVLLGAGTFNLTTGITFAGRNDVTLRGSGPDATFLVFSTANGFDGCQGGTTTICIPGTDLGYYGPGTPTHTATWTAAAYTQGQTVITMSSVTGLATGMYLVLDQLDDTTNPGTDIFVCGDVNCVDEGGATGYGRPGRSQRQWVKVTNIAASVVTFTPGLYAPNWALAKTPGAYWGNSTSLSTKDGIEDLSIDGLNSPAQTSLIELIFTTNSWVKNVRGLYGSRTYVQMYDGVHNTVRDSYFFGSVSEVGGPTHYGIEALNSGDNLIENNIVSRRTTPYISNGDVGSVWAYNFAVNDQYSVSPTFMQASNYSHFVGNFMVLHESNQAVGIKGDIVHGTSNLFTFFRNYSLGWETGKTSETEAVILFAYNRYWNLIGNVLGTVAYHDTYESASLRVGTIFSLGIAGAVPTYDAVVATTLMRWGNYDTVNAATRWVSAEVPSGIGKYPNAVPATQVLPSSFYLAAKPTFYGSLTWPSIGPDVTTGGVPGNHVVRIPARVCFEDVMGGLATDVTPRTFNWTTCLAAFSSAIPNAPASVRNVSDSTERCLTLIWAPSPESDLAGYKVYSGIASGQTTTLLKTITAATAQAVQSPMTQYMRCSLPAGLTYFTVTAYNGNGNESVKSSEVSKNIPGLSARGVRQ